MKEWRDDVITAPAVGSVDTQVCQSWEWDDSGFSYYSCIYLKSWTNLNFSNFPLKIKVRGQKRHRSHWGSAPTGAPTIPFPLLFLNPGRRPTKYTGAMIVLNGGVHIIQIWDLMIVLMYSNLRCTKNGPTTCKNVKVLVDVSYGGLQRVNTIGACSKSLSELDFKVRGRGQRQRSRFLKISWTR